MIRRSLPAVALLLLCGLVATAQRLPEPLGYVSDFAGVIDSRDEAAITRIAEEVQEKTGAQIAVATLASMEPYGSIEELGVALATGWGVGEKGKDNGVLLLIAMKERRARIEVGYGLEGAIPDGLAGQILDQEMIPSFRSGDYGSGFRRGVEAVAAIVASEAGVELGSFDASDVRDYESTRGGTLPISTLIWFLVIFFFVGGRFLWPLIFMGGFRGRRRYYGGGFGSGSFGGRSGFGGFGGGGFGGGGASRGF
jgi:uncharacterized protein